MQKIQFTNGTTINGASTFNAMQDNVEDVFNGKTPMGSIVVEDIKSKNLFNKDNTLGYCYIDSETGEIKPYAYYSNSVYILDVSKYNNIVVSGALSGDTYALYNSNDEYISGGAYTNGVAIDVSSADVIKLNIKTDYFNTTQIEPGTKISEYTPFKQFSNLQHYSNNEQIIGTLMGKPLYQKTYEITSTTVNIDAAPYDLLFVHEAIIELTTGVTFTMGRYRNSTDFFTTYAYKNNYIVSIDLGSTWTISKGFITVRYTKTTDIGTSTLEEGK